jgi:hypothetical protein
VILVKHTIGYGHSYVSSGLTESIPDFVRASCLVRGGLGVSRDTSSLSGPSMFPLLKIQIFFYHVEHLC